MYFMYEYMYVDKLLYRTGHLGSYIILIIGLLLAVELSECVYYLKQYQMKL